MRAQEFILEETMPELEYDGSLNYSEERNGITLRAWIEEAGRLEISASIDGQEVGSVSFINFGDHLQASTAKVKPEYRRQGIARMMYDFAEELGNDLEASHALTDPGKAFWRNRDPEADIVESVDFEQMQPQQIVAVAQDAFAQLYPDVKLYGKSVVEGVGLTTAKGQQGAASAFAGSDTVRGAFYLTLNAYAEGNSMIVVVEDATAGQYKGAATAVIKALFEAGERLYKTEQRELVINDNANSEAWSAIADRVGAEMMESIELAEEQEHDFTTAYHITTEENAGEITDRGLRPSDGEVYLVVDQGDPKKLKAELYEVAHWMYARIEDSDEDLNLLKVDVSGIPLTYKDGWYRSPTSISANRITNLGSRPLAGL
jgi:predicted GNAT family acetyltransferase